MIVFWHLVSIGGYPSPYGVIWPPPYCDYDSEIWSIHQARSQRASHKQDRLPIHYSDWRTKYERWLYNENENWKHDRIAKYESISHDSIYFNIKQNGDDYTNDGSGHGRDRGSSNNNDDKSNDNNNNNGNNDDTNNNSLFGDEFDIMSVSAGTMDRATNSYMVDDNSGNNNNTNGNNGNNNGRNGNTTNS